MALDFSKVVKGVDQGSEGKQVMNPFDLAEAEDTLSLIIKGLDDMDKEASDIEIKTDADAARVTEMLGQAVGLRKTIETKRSRIVEKPYRFYKNVSNLFRSPDQRLEGMISLLKRKLGDYSRKKELERKKAEKKAQEEHAKRQARLFKLAEESGVSKKDLELEKPVIPKKQSPIRTQSGSASVKMGLVPVVVDEKKVPREYLVVNLQAIKAAVKSGLTDPDWWLERGVELREEAKVSVRT